MRRLLKINSFLYFLFILACHCKAQTKNNNAKPNIVFIISDDHAYQAIGAYGNSIAHTPNIDRIAKEGAIFKNSFVTNSLCGPSRATFLTGKYSHLNGYKLNETKFNTGQILFSKILQQNNYQTAWVGKWHLGSLPKGFDYFSILKGQGNYYNPDFISTQNDTAVVTGYVTNIITKKSIDWLDQRDTSKPFCLVIGEKATHREWLPDIQDLGAYDSINFPIPKNFFDTYEGRIAAFNQDMTIDKTMRLKEDLKINLDYQSGDYQRLTAEQKKPFETYYNAISKSFNDQKLSGTALVKWKFQRYLKDYLAVANSLDRNIGMILDYLDKKGLAENTVVIYVSDQGFYLGEHGWFDKRFMYEESLRTPFVIRYPDFIKQGTSIQQFVSNLDWAPTILNIAGAKIPEEMQGNSLVPLFKKQTEPKAWRNEVYYHYYEYPQPHHVAPHFGIRTTAYKLIRFYGVTDYWELFDLKKDPNEMNNIYSSKDSDKISIPLKRKLIALIKEYKDDEALQILKKEGMQ